MKKISLFCLYAVFIIWLYRFCGLDSDQANHLLQADDILSGNFFLNDWHLTGVTFFTTDLIYFEIAKLLCGVRYRAIYVASGLKFLSIVVTAYYVTMKGCCKDQKLKKGLFLFLAAVPCMSYMIDSRVHAGAVCLTFFSFCVVYDILNNLDQNDRKLLGKWKYILLAVVTASGAIGDMLAVIEGTIPILFLCLFQLLIRDGWHRGSKYVKVTVAAIIGIFTGMIWDWLYFWISSANKNSYIGKKLFTELSAWTEKVVSFVNYILEMCAADFTGTQIADIWNFPKFVNAVIVIAGFVFIIIFIRKIIIKEDKEVDEISVLLTVSIVMSFLAFVLTDMAEKRYIALVPYAVVAIVIRNCSQIIEYFNNRKTGVIIIVIAAILSFAGKIKEISAYQYPQSNIEDYKLITFLKEHDLHYGYASFWNASKITVLSGKEINVRHIMHSGETENGLSKFEWFCKNEWYEENTNFVLINNEEGTDGEDDIFGVSKKRATEFFGVPQESYVLDKYLILVYDYNISEKLCK